MATPVSASTVPREAGVNLVVIISADPGLFRQYPYCSHTVRGRWR